VGEEGRGILERCRISGGSGPAVEVSRYSETVFRNCKVIAGEGEGVIGHSQAKAIFIEADVVAADGKKWRLANGHQVQRV